MTDDARKVLVRHCQLLGEIRRHGPIQRTHKPSAAELRQEARPPTPCCRPSCLFALDLYINFLPTQVALAVDTQSHNECIQTAHLNKAH